MKEAEGVEDAQVSYEKGEARIKYDDEKITLARLREVINSTGFKAEGIVRPAKNSPGRGKRKAAQQ